jgi:hypothetical protein
MFYILFHHSTIVKKNKLFYTLLYGSLLYLVIHIIMMFSDIESLKIFKDNYFWTILSIDLCTFLYLFISGSTLSTNGIVEGNNNELDSILKPFKDEINKVLNQNNEIKMTKQEPVISFPSNNEKIVLESEINTNQIVNNNQNDNINNNQNDNINNNQNDNINNNQNDNINNNQVNNISVNDNDSSTSSGNYSTPINRLNKNNNQPIINNNQSIINNNQPIVNSNQSNSTNVMDLRDRLASQAQDMKPEGFTRIDNQNNNSNQNMNNFNQNMSIPIKKDMNYKSDTLSVADSDIGSAFDLDLNDFENSIN